MAKKIVKSALWGGLIEIDTTPGALETANRYAKNLPKKFHPVKVVKTGNGYAVTSGGKVLAAFK